jgi:hypothetical protein
MQKKQYQAGSGPIQVPPIPSVSEVERGLASIALNFPEKFVSAITDKRFKVSDIHDPLSSVLINVISEQVTIGASTDIRIIFEKTRENIPDIRLGQITEIQILCAIEYPLHDYIDIIKNTAKRRQILAVACEIIEDVGCYEIQTQDIVYNNSLKIEAIGNELNPPDAADTKALILAAIDRYQNGDDKTQRISTGLNSIDNLTPIRFGDFLVIGGQEKSGKSMLATNIIANIIQNEAN